MLAIEGGERASDLAGEILAVEIPAVAPHQICTRFHVLISSTLRVAFNSGAICITAVGPTVLPVFVSFNFQNVDCFPPRNHCALILLLRVLFSESVRISSHAAVPLLLLLLLVWCLLWLLICLPLELLCHVR